jgi:hypothetical protein
MNTKTKRGEEKNNINIINKISFLEKFFEYSPKRRDVHLQKFDPISIQKVSNYSIVNNSEMHLVKEDIKKRIITEAYEVLHRVHSGCVQQIILEYQKDNNSNINVVPNQGSRIFKNIFLEYKMRFFNQEEIFYPVFVFFWKLTLQINKNTDFLKGRVGIIDHLNMIKNQSDTKLLISEIIEKILIGDFVSPLEIMLIKNDFDNFNLLIQLRHLISLEQAYYEPDFKRQEFVQI